MGTYMEEKIKVLEWRSKQKKVFV